MGPRLTMDGVSPWWLLLAALVIYWLWRELARLDSTLLVFRGEIKNWNDNLVRGVNTVSVTLTRGSRGLQDDVADLEEKIAENSRGHSACASSLEICLIALAECRVALEEHKVTLREVAASGTRTSTLLELLLAGKHHLMSERCVEFARNGDLNSLQSVYIHYGRLMEWGPDALSATVNQGIVVDQQLAILAWLTKVGCPPGSSALCAALYHGNTRLVELILSVISEEAHAKCASRLAGAYTFQGMESNLEVFTLALNAGLYQPTLRWLTRSCRKGGGMLIPRETFLLALGKTTDMLHPDEFKNFFQCLFSCKDENTVLFLSEVCKRVDGKVILPENYREILDTPLCTSQEVREWTRLQVDNGAAVWG